MRGNNRQVVRAGLATVFDRGGHFWSWSRYRGRPRKVTSRDGHNKKPGKGGIVRSEAPADLGTIGQLMEDKES